MKKIIFLLVFVVSSVFCQTITRVDIYDGQSSSNTTCSISRTNNPFIYNGHYSDCESLGVFLPSENATYGSRPCHVEEFYTVKEGTCSPYSGGYDFRESVKRTITLTFTCSNSGSGCPVGQTFDEQTCTCKSNPVCPAGKLYNSSLQTCICKNDSNNDGKCDDCDYSNPDYNILDCDGDGIPNGSDDDVDGDGVKNGSDADSNGDGIPDASDPNSPTSSGSCKGANWDNGIHYGSIYKKDEYSYRGTLVNSSCSALVSGSITGSISLPDLDSNCAVTYCFVHDSSSLCNYKASDYEPLGSNWVYYSSLKSQVACYEKFSQESSKYLDYRFVAPSPTICPASSYCYLQVKQQDANNTKPYEYQPGTDSNSSLQGSVGENNASFTIDFTPVVNEIKSTNKILETIKSNSDITNNNLSDLKSSANSILNVNREISDTLTSLSKDSKASLSNQLDTISSLSAVNTSLTSSNVKLNNIGSTLSTFGTKFDATNTKLDGIGSTLSTFGTKFDATNTKLDGIGSKIDVTNSNIDTTNNKLNITNQNLANISSKFDGDGSVPDESSFFGFSDALDNYGEYVEDIKSQFSTFKTNIQNNYDGILQKYNDTSVLITSGQFPVMSGGGNLDCASFDFHGKHISLDLSKVAIIQPIVYYIFTAFFMVLNFQFLFNQIFGKAD